MKRSESVLVYGVTGVLVVILGIAIIFGDKPADAASRDGQSAGENGAGENGAGGRDSAATSLARHDGGEEGSFFANSTGAGDGDVMDLDDLLSDPATFEDSAERDLPASSGPSGLGENLDSSEFVDHSAGGTPTVPGGGVALSRTLGPSRVIESPDRRYTMVPVRAGDTASVLIQRWCPGTEQAVIAALNETVDLNRLRVGQEVMVPWVDRAILLEAQEARLERARIASLTPRPATSPAGSAGGLDVGGRPAVNAGGDLYTVKKGESLWKIAERKVGAKKAMAYIEEIVRANSNISDSSHVRDGMKIVLP